MRLGGVAYFKAYMRRTDKTGSQEASEVTATRPVCGCESFAEARIACLGPSAVAEGGSWR